MYSWEVKHEVIEASSGSLLASFADSAFKQHLFQFYGVYLDEYRK